MTPITRTALKKLAGNAYFKRGVDYYNAGTVVQPRANRDGITARVQGSEPMPYLVRFWHEKQKLQWGCACPLGDEGAFCKHLVATGLAHLAGDEIGHVDSEPDNAEASEEIRELLKTLDRAALEDLITQQALWDERLFAELRLLGGAARKFTIKTNSYLIFTSECGTGAYSFTYYRDLRVGAYRLVPSHAFLAISRYRPALVPGADCNPSQALISLRVRFQLN